MDKVALIIEVTGLGGDFCNPKDHPGVARLKHGLQEKLRLGNLDVMRD